MVVYVVKFKVLNIRRSIWRSIRIHDGVTFQDLSDVINLLFGFEGFYSYDFEIKDIRKRIINYDKALTINPGELDSNEELIDDYFGKYDEIIYTYNFKDPWVISVDVKEVLDETIEYPEVVDFNGEYNLLEDCGSETYEVILQKAIRYGDGESDPVIENEIGNFINDTFEKYDINDASDIGIDEDGNATEKYDEFIATLLNDNLIEEEGELDFTPEVSNFLDFLQNLNALYERELVNFIDRSCDKYGIDDLSEIEEDEELKEKWEDEFERFTDEFLAKFMLKNEFDAAIGHDFLSDSASKLMKFDKNFVNLVFENFLKGF